MLLGFWAAPGLPWLLLEFLPGLLLGLLVGSWVSGMLLGRASELLDLLQGLALRFWARFWADGVSGRPWAPRFRNLESLRVPSSKTRETLSS